jgi:hypothetical protein
MIEMQIVAFLFLSMLGAGGAIVGWGMVRASYAAASKAKRRSRLRHATRPLVVLTNAERELQHLAAMRAYANDLPKVPYGWDKVEGGATR